MLQKQQINWIEPLDLAAQVAVSDYQENWVFLYSGLSSQIKNSKSYLCLYPQKEIIADDFLELEKSLSSQYFGYLGYDLKNQLEHLKNGKKSFIDLPNLWMINFGLVLEFDCDRKILTEFSSQSSLQIPTKSSSNFPAPSSNSPTSSSNFPKSSSQRKLGSQLVGRDPSFRWDDDVGELDDNIEKLDNDVKKYDNPRKYDHNLEYIHSNFTKSEYLKKVKTIQTKIKNGDIYQANLTRKFFGKFKEKPKNPFDIFLKLNRVSPANYSAFLKLGENYLISSSPELFLKIDEQGQVLSSPIKGTAKRFSDKKLDDDAKKNLQNSPKEQAENLMIVDLVRNDLSRFCEAGSVKVKNLFKASTYKTVHHLSSDIVGIKKAEASSLDIIKSSFPAGSMTGAPKIKAMEICQELEQQNRGVYSGAIGFIGSETCELSVVIRTLIIKENQFEFQVGGAITFDSNPQKEWQETINKARGIAKTLEIKLSDLRKI